MKNIFFCFYKAEVIRFFHEVGRKEFNFEIFLNIWNIIKICWPKFNFINISGEKYENIIFLKTSLTWKNEKKNLRSTSDA